MSKIDEFNEANRDHKKLCNININPHTKIEFDVFAGFNKAVVNVKSGDYDLRQFSLEGINNVKKEIDQLKEIIVTLSAKSLKRAYDEAREEAEGILSQDIQEVLKEMEVEK